MSPKTIASQITRRRFISAAAAALAAPTIVPSSAFGANDRINLGVIGIGKQGEYHLGQLKHHAARVRVVAVAEVYATFRDKAVQMMGGAGACIGYNDYREMLARPDLDAVVIVTPDHWHALMSIDAMKAGKDVFCEKPLSLTIAEARAMVTAARQYGRVFQTGSMQRSSWEFRKACELVRNGYIGQVKEVLVGIGGPSEECYLPAEPTPAGLDWDRWIGPAPYRPFNAILRPPHNDTFPAWRSYRDFSGGGMTDWGAHHFDIAQWGLGMDESGPAEIIPPDDKDVKDLTYIYANGVIMKKTGPGGVTFIGQRGTVFVTRGQIATQPQSLRYLTFKQSDLRLYESNDHHRDWFDCIRTRQRPICDAEVGARSVSVCHLGNIAFRLKRPLKWDPKAERFIGDTDANRLLSRAYRAPYAL